MGVQIRRATGADVPRMVELWRIMWQFHQERDPRFASTPLAEPFMARWFEDNLSSDRAVLLAAEMDGAVLGYALGFIVDNPPVVPWPFYGHVSEVSVDPAHQRRGIGQALVAALHDAFRARGCSYVEAFISTANPVSRAFWRKLGYGEFIERLRLDFPPAPR